MKYVLSILFALWSIGTWGQNNNFNPENPPEPIAHHKLVLSAIPAGSVYFDRDTVSLVEEGSSASVYASPRSGYDFEGWKMDDKIVSTENSYTFTVGASDIHLTAVCRFNPENPGSPNSNFWNAATGEIIIDDFAPGGVSSIYYEIIGKNSISTDQVTKVTVLGEINAGDFDIARDLEPHIVLDLKNARGVSTIQQYAFSNISISSITLPSDITTIEQHAFYECSNLSEITCYAIAPPKLQEEAFSNISGSLIIRVPQTVLALYTGDPAWSQYTILPLTEEVGSLTVNLPKSASDGRYKNMTLELANIKNAQKQRYILSDRMTYTFNGLIRDNAYSVFLKNRTGNTLGEIKDIKIAESNDTVEFSTLLELQSIKLKVLTPQQKDVTESVRVTWFDSDDEYLAQGNELSGLTTGTHLKYKMELNQELGMQYLFPEPQSFITQENKEQPVYNLQPIDTLTVSGIVKDGDGNLLPNAVISVSQQLNGTYSKAFTTQTGTDGAFRLKVYNDYSTITIAATNYISQKLTKENFNEGDDLGEIKLKSISGTLISTNFTYTGAVIEGETPEKQNSYSDYENITYAIYNVTQEKEVTEFAVQHPNLVLLEEVNKGDRLRITASSKTHAFMPVEALATVNEEDRIEVHFDIIGLGGIKASYQSSADNATIVGILYGSNGELIKKYTYSDSSLSIHDLADGTYTLVSMSKSAFFNSILRLSQLASSGLTEGTDYQKNEVSVKSGIISQVINKEIPTLDESKLYYTGENTLFSANKSSLAVGNYLTLKAKIDFKEEFAGSVKDVKMIVDLPTACSFVENSLMVGNQISSYSLDGKQLTVPLENYNDQIRFCIVPTTGGSYSPNAFVEFNLEGTTILQPIGSANYETENMSLIVPKATAQKTINVRGNAPFNSRIRVYDNATLIGETKSLSNGAWSLKCDLYDTYSYSFHNVYAEIITPDNFTLTTETKEIIYDKNTTEVSKVTMLYRDYEIVFDFINATNTSNHYSYVPGNDATFTFLADFTKNDPNLIDDVSFKVKLSDGSVSSIPGKYNDKHQSWVGSRTFPNSNRIPTNVTVDFTNKQAGMLNDTLRSDKEDELLSASMEKTINSLKTDNMEVIEDSENKALFAYKDDSPTIYCQIQILDYNTEIDQLKSGDFYHLQIENSDFYLKEALDEKQTTIILWSDIEKYAAKISCAIDKSLFTPTRSAKPLDITMPDLSFKTAGAVFQFIGYEDFVKGTREYDFWVDKYYKCMDDHLAVEKKVFNMIVAKCSDGSFRLNKATMERFNKYYNTCKESTTKMEQEFGKLLEKYKSLLLWDFARNSGLNLATLGIGGKLPKIFNGEVGEWLGKHLSFFKNKKYREDASDFITENYVGKVAGDLTGMATDFKDMPDLILAWYNDNEQSVLNTYIELKADIVKAYNPCPKEEEGEDDEQEEEEDKDISFPNPNLTPAIDPSGYVYEAVPSNRLQGVTATCYYKKKVVDMYGDEHEEIVLWNAAEYAQENPLFTDENGMYAWDVPQGLWQVKFEKEGYQTTYSDWLPVPPPQLDVNIGMTQSVQPTVVAVRGFETGIEIEFSKYMLPATMNTEQIMVTCNGTAVTGEVFLQNEEANPYNNHEKFASKVRFAPAKAFATTDKVVLTVSRRVQSYAGIQMENDFSQEIDIEKEAKSILVEPTIEVAYNRTVDITVTVDPKEAAANKKITALSSAPIIATVTPEATLDENGKATFTIGGELLGSTNIRFRVDGMELKADVKVNVLTAVTGESAFNYYLNEGWNWLSVNVNDQHLNNLPALLEPIKASVLTLKSPSGELVNDSENGWQGSLDMLNPTEAFKIKMKRSATLEIKGKPATPEGNTITLRQGWNWIGYMPTVTLPVEESLKNLQAETNDLIKGLDNFAIYNGSAWVGSLTHLAPGEGYMYYSQSVKSFNYSASETEADAPYTTPQWNYDANLSEDNLPVIAELYDGEQKAEPGKYLIGAFINDECRGIAVEKEGYLFITVHGEPTDGAISLRAFNTADQKEYDIKEKVEWTGAWQGELTAPIGLHIGEVTGMEPVFEGALIYPSPVRDRLYIRETIESMEEVRIANTRGQTLIVQEQVRPNEGVDVSALPQGIYVITIRTSNDVIQQKFMKIE